MSQLNIHEYCQQHALKLTPWRTNVLDIMSEQKKPLTAYEILDLLKERNPKAQVMSVYRVLDFLQVHGLVHRIESQNAFMLCHHLSKKDACADHVSQWFICKDCGHTIENTNDELDQLIEKMAAEHHFTITAPTIELIGLCAHCQQKENHNKKE